MNNPQQTFKNICEMQKMGIKSSHSSHENKLPNWLTKSINYTIVATLIIGTIYLIKMIF
jgi:ascorbate-specific PTS system EIIC-type component UlaA